MSGATGWPWFVYLLMWHEKVTDCSVICRDNGGPEGMEPDGIIEVIKLVH